MRVERLALLLSEFQSTEKQKQLRSKIKKEKAQDPIIIVCNPYIIHLALISKTKEKREKSNSVHPSSYTQRQVSGDKYILNRQKIFRNRVLNVS